MRIGGIVPLSLQDYPGHPALVVFTQGCNLRCPWCHNPELVDPAQFDPPLPLSEVITLCHRRRRFLDAMVISGGEPTLHHDLANILATAKKLGYATKLDTNGTHPPAVAHLMQQGLVDILALDYKVPLRLYPSLGAEPGDIKASLRLALGLSATQRIIRTTVVPSIHTPAVLAEMQDELVQLGLGDLDHWTHQPFRPGHCLDPTMTS